MIERSPTRACIQRRDDDAQSRLKTKSWLNISQPAKLKIQYHLKVTTKKRLKTQYSEATQVMKECRNTQDEIVDRIRIKR